MSKLALVCFVAAGMSCLASGQVPGPLEFEVASVKPNHLDDRIVTLHIGPGGRFSVRGYTLGLLIQQAYGIMGWGVMGGPAWMRSDRFDIDARVRVASDLTSALLRPILQALLVDRFRLTLRKVPKELPGYELVIARGGPKLEASTAEEAPLEAVRMWNSEISGDSISAETFAVAAGSLLGSPVVNRTGLRGLYNVKVGFRDESPQFRSLPGASDVVAAGERDYSALFDNLERELGLRLVPKKVTVDVLLIDSAQQPSAN